MATGKTTRRSLPYPKTTDAPKVATDMEALAEALDNDVEGGQGTLAARPGAPYTRGRLYVVQGDTTTANNGIVWWDNGTNWIAVTQLAAESVGTSQLEPEAVTRGKIEANLIADNGTALKIQAGAHNLGARSAGWLESSIPLSYTFPTACVSFVAVAYGTVNNAGMDLAAASVESAGAGRVVIDNNVEQQINVNYIAAGY